MNPHSGYLPSHTVRNNFRMGNNFVGSNTPTLDIVNLGFSNWKNW